MLVLKIYIFRGAPSPYIASSLLYSQIRGLLSAPILGPWHPFVGLGISFHGFSARLFQLLEAKTHVLKPPAQKARLVRFKK